MLSSDVREWDCERPPTTRLNQLLLRFRNWGQVARSDWLISAHLTLILLSDWLISIRSNNMCWPTECLYYQDIIIIWDLNLLIIDQQIHCLIALWSQTTEASSVAWALDIFTKIDSIIFCFSWSWSSIPAPGSDQRRQTIKTFVYLIVKRLNRLYCPDCPPGRADRVNTEGEQWRSLTIQVRINRMTKRLLLSVLDWKMWIKDW